MTRLASLSRHASCRTECASWMCASRSSSWLLGSLMVLLVFFYATMGVLWKRPTFSIYGNSSNRGGIEEKKIPATTGRRTFPKWGRTVEDENRDGIALSDLLHFLFTSSVFAATAPKDSKQQYLPLQDHIHDQLGRMPETLYVVDKGGRLYMSQMHRDLQKSIRDDKLNHTERIMLQALQRLKDQDANASCEKSAWPHLCRALSNEGFPFLAWYGDYTGCSQGNWQYSEDEAQQGLSIPLFTVAAAVQCAFTWPFPNYYHIKSLLPTSRDWDAVFPLYEQRYPWADKIQRVGWRGSLTGNIVDATTKCPRWNLMHAVQQINNGDLLFDVAITKLPPRARPFSEEIVADIGVIQEDGGSDDLLKFLDFQKYRALLDIDGHSWSGRFGSLLCFNSVVLKVEPTYVDYFYNKYQNPNRNDEDEGKYTLNAWKHYIPVRDDFSDLQEQAEFALDHKNEAAVQQIVRNANDWCRHTMIEPVVERDMLNVWERYLQLVDINDSNWSKFWKGFKADVMSAGSLFQMVELFRDDYPAFQNVAAFPK